MAKPTAVPLKPLIPQLPLANLKWHAVLTEFFQTAGLRETVRGLETDLLVLSRAQHERLPAALQKLGEEVGGFAFLLTTAENVRGAERGGL
jgi:hypothetical protein